MPTIKENNRIADSGKTEISMTENSKTENNKRIARNTLMLYFRMLVMMAAQLYTSRVVLDALGVTDFGIYSVVGGLVAMGNILSQSFSAAIGRFLTFELGRCESGAKNDGRRLRGVFAASVLIQLGLGCLIVLLAETAGVWFLGSHMTIAPERLTAANWVLQFSVAAFAVQLLSVPYNALITAHERMKAFAYVSLIEAGFKLGIAFLIAASGTDRLVLYAALMLMAALVVRGIYAVYCHRHFEESRLGSVWKSGFWRSDDSGESIISKEIFREMFGYSGWNAIGAAAGVLKTNGVDVVLNLFCGTVVNSARGIATQATNAVQLFVSNFMIAVNPQITKRYAAGETDYAFTLVMKSSRLSFMLVLLLSSPLFIAAEYILDLWLVDVPAHTLLFVRLGLVLCLADSISNPLITLQLATGRIRNYQLTVGGLLMLNMPASYVCMLLGCAPETVVVVAVCVSAACTAARLIMLRRMVAFPVGAFCRLVLAKDAAVTAVVGGVIAAGWTVLPIEGLWECAAVCAAVVAAGAAAIFFLGLEKGEREYVLGQLRARL